MRAQSPATTSSILQRQCQCGAKSAKSTTCPKCGGDEAPNRLRREADSDRSTDEVPEIVYQVLQAPGQPLDEATRSFMEPRFSHDFSHVRVHSDSAAAASAQAVDAVAYTVGSHIVLGDDAPGFGSRDYLRLFAHELTHTIQQSNMGANISDQSLAVGRDDDVSEQEARHAANAVVTLRAPPAPSSDSGAMRFLRRQRRNEMAGGCGVCEPPWITGTRVHALLTQLFHRTHPGTQPEAPVPSPTDEENGRLDLMRVQWEPTPPNLIDIGEIKPDNDRGRANGRRDLLFYQAAVQQLFPLPMFAVGFLDLPAPMVSLPYVDPLARPECAQSLSLRNVKIGGQPGLYLYSCQPARSGMNRQRCCRPRQPEPEEQRERRRVPIPEPVPVPVPVPIPGPVPVPVPDVGPRPAPQPTPQPAPQPAPDREPNVIPFPTPKPTPAPAPEPESQPIAARWSWEAVVTALLVIGLSLAMIATVAACILDPEPASKVALCGLTAAEFAALMLILNGPEQKQSPEA